MVKLPPSLKLGRIMLETSTLALEDTLNFSCTTKVSVEGYNISEKKIGLQTSLSCKKLGYFSIIMIYKIYKP